MGGSTYWRPVYEDKPKKSEKKKSEDKDLEEKKEPTEDDKKLAQIYQDMRIATMRLEELIESSTSFTAKDLHRLDKSVVVQKVGYKMVKNILKKKGFSELKRSAFQELRTTDESGNSLVN